jgi:hypothetical protein
MILLIGGVRPVGAVSSPIIDARIFGIELCPQFVCGVAIFTGALRGQVGGNPDAIGSFAVAVTHEDLPDPYETAAITGGVFEFRVGLRRIKGYVATGGLLNNGNNTFTVKAVLVIQSGGSGTVEFTGLLNHNTFPPTISGAITQ